MLLVERGFSPGGYREMCVNVVISLAVFLMLSPAYPEADVSGETSQILVRLSEIEGRLDRIEQSLQQLRLAVSQLPGGNGALDVRQTPEYRALERRLEGLQEKVRSEPLKTLEEIWRAMGDPKELARRLDRLAEAFGPTICEAERREEFDQDVRALKERIGKEISEDELYEKVRERISERLKRASNEREKAWLQRQLDALELAEGPERTASLARYVRIGNVGAVQELAKKYSMLRDRLVKCGLAFVGRGRRPPRPYERRDRTGPPRMPPRDRTRPRRGRDRREPPR